MPKARKAECGVCGGPKTAIGSRLACSPCNTRRAKEWAQANPERANARNRRHRAENPERARAIARASKLMITYGLDLDAYEAILREQGGLCAICRRVETRQHRGGKLWSLSVDHDHKTGAIRGLLCSGCNVGLSNFREDPASLARAIAYLEESKWDR